MCVLNVCLCIRCTHIHSGPEEGIEWPPGPTRRWSCRHPEAPWPGVCCNVDWKYKQRETSAFCYQTCFPVDILAPWFVKKSPVLWMGSSLSQAPSLSPLERLHPFFLLYCAVSRIILIYFQILTQICISVSFIHLYCILLSIPLLSYFLKNLTFNLIIGSVPTHLWV